MSDNTAPQTCETFAQARSQAVSQSALPSFVRDIDAETLYFFATLFRTGSLPRTAERMGVSLSSANRMLAKLRRYWNAPLFVRSGALMQPTQEAKEKFEKVVALLRMLETLERGTEVDPGTLKRTVRVACYDNAFAAPLGSIHAELARLLPRVRFQVIQADEHMFDLLREDKIDLLFFARQGLQPDVHAAPVLTTPYVCVVRRGHPLVRVASRHGAVGKPDLRPYGQVLINAQPDRYRQPNSPGNGFFNPDDPEKIALVTPFFLSVPICLKNTDCYSIVPEVTARLAFDTSALELLPVTADAPTLTISLGWHERAHSDPGSQYIRSVLLDRIAQSTRRIFKESD